MPIYARAVCAVGFVLALGACAQQEEPAPIAITPTVDKLGNATCPVGTTLATDAETGVQVCTDVES